MVTWSPLTLKFTLGIGAICSAAIISELSQQAVSVWVALVLALTPLAVFVFADPRDVRHSLARLLQVAASLWYLIVNSVFLVFFVSEGDLRPGWPIFVIGLAVGAIPCLLVLWRAVLPGAIAEPGNSEDGQCDSSTVAGAKKPGNIDTSRPAVYRPKIGKLLLSLLVSCLFVAGGVLMIADGQWFGWLVVAFFGACAIVFGMELIPDCSYLRLSSTGIEVRSLWRTSRYAWSDIPRFYSGQIGRNKMVVFDFSPSCRNATTARAAAKALTGVAGALPDTYGFTAEALAEHLNQWKASLDQEESNLLEHPWDGGD